MSHIPTLNLTQTLTLTRTLTLSLTTDRNLTHPLGPDPEVKPHHITETTMALAITLTSIPTLVTSTITLNLTQTPTLNLATH